MSIEERLFSVVRRVIPDVSVPIDDSLCPERCPTWDSVTTINLMFLIEEEFGIGFEGNSFMEFSNLGAVRVYLERVAS